jgi:DNA-directed RNA polymerase II subunit RPB3
MQMRFSRDCDACDGDGSCEYCSVEFHLAARATDSDQTLEVTSNDLRSMDPKVCPVDQARAYQQALGGTDPFGANTSNENRQVIHHLASCPTCLWSYCVLLNSFCY